MATGSAAGINAGGATVTVGTNHGPFDRGMGHVYRQLTHFQQMLRRIGTQMTVAGAGLGYPLVRATQAAAGFEDALLELQASVPDATPQQLKAVRDEAIRLGQAMGATPTEIAQAFAMLTKAGMSVEEAMGGAAKSAVEFARVSGVSAQDAATFMKVSMNVFGVSAEEAVNTLSAAADASETSIASMVQAFSLVSSAGKQFGQSLFGLSQGFGALARYGIQGEEAGTGLKTLFTKLVAPTNEASQALAKYGLTLRSFRGADGNLLPLVQIADLFAQKMKDVDRVIGDQALVDVFDVRGIKIISALADLGKEGLDDLAQAMEANRTVSQKYAIMTGGLTGFFMRLHTAVQIVSIAFGEALSPTLQRVGVWLTDTAKRVHDWIKEFPEVARMVAGLTFGLVALGTAFIGLSLVLSPVRAGMVLFAGIANRAVSFVGGLATAVRGLSVAFVGLRAAIHSVPLIGWVLAGVSALAVFGSMLDNMWTKKGKAAGKPAGPGGGAAPAAKPAKKPQRDLFREAMGNAGPTGEGRGTMSGEVTSQLGVGPQITVATRTADATERAADGIDEIAAMMREAQGAADGLVRDAAVEAGNVAKTMTEQQARDMGVVRQATGQVTTQPQSPRQPVGSASVRDSSKWTERAAVAAEATAGTIYDLKRRLDRMPGVVYS